MFHRKTFERVGNVANIMNLCIFDLYRSTLKITKYSPLFSTQTFPEHRDYSYTLYSENMLNRL